MSTNTRRNKILLIGWDAADWKVITPLLDAGKMPALEGLINDGVMGNLATIRPVLSPMLWTSIATGKRAYKHGIHGFAEPTADGSGIQPVTNLSRSTKAFWNIFHQNGMRGHVVGWWPSSPAEPINGVMVSNHFQRAPHNDPTKPWPMLAGTVSPKEKSRELSEFRVHPAELQQEHILPFIPHAAEVDQKNDVRMTGCLKIIADCAGIQGVATHLLQTESWDYAAIYFDAIDHFCHGFMRYHPPRQDFVDEQDFRLYSNVVQTGYQYHDLMLNTLLHLAGEDTTVVLLSDHGFQSDHLRLKGMPIEPAAPALEHRDLGILVMKGPGIRKDERIHGASLLDICPTLLTIAGLPVGKDMDGAPLLQAWEEPPQVQQIESWDQVEGDSGQHPPDAKLDPRESQEAIQQLVDLGYIDQPAEDRQQAIDDAVAELNYNLAVSYIDGQRLEEAVEILERLIEQDPTVARVAMRLLFCYHSLGRIKEMKPLLEQARTTGLEKAKNAARALADLVNELYERPDPSPGPEASPEDPSTPGSTQQPQRKADDDWQLDRRKRLEAIAKTETILRDDRASTEDVQAARQELNRLRQEVWDMAMERADKSERTQAETLRRHAENNPLTSYSFTYLDGCVLSAEGKIEEALERFRKAEQVEPNRPGLPIQIGEAYQQLARWADAERSFQRAIQLDPENAQAFAGLARTYLGQRRNRDAADAALTAVGLMYFYPYAHYILGTALHRIGDLNRAVEALNVAVQMNPSFPAAHDRLAQIYQNRLDMPEEAKRHRELAAQAAAQGPSSSMPKQTVGMAVDPEQRQRDWDDIGSWIPNRPLHQPGLDLSKVITVVSGLPRSGTSMLMQMLAAGGVPPMTDRERTADDDNPRGYYEFERVKSLRSDSSWLDQAQGKAIKVIAQLLKDLPPKPYRIIYVDRNLDEIVQSQRVMLERHGKSGAKLSQEQLKDAFAKQVRAIGEMLDSVNVPVLKVSHQGCMEDPLAVAREINEFLGGALNETAMVTAVDKTLYRQRRSVETPTS